jgi:CNT family concentrative nucleoside transporter
MNDCSLTVLSIVRGLAGISLIIFCCFLLSENRKAIKWSIILPGLLMQLLIGLGVLYVPFFFKSFEFIGKIFITLINCSKEGAHFLFGDLAYSPKVGFIFAFQILPAIVFIGALTGMLYHYGIIQWTVKLFARTFQKVIRVSGPESMGVIANIFLGQSESPLFIKSYLGKMSRSEFFQIMVVGFSMLAGTVLVAYIIFLGGNDPQMQIMYAKHLIAASVMAAPGAIVIAKILIPQDSETNPDMYLDQRDRTNNVLGAIANGTTDGLKLAVNVAAMLLVFISFIALFNFIADKVGAWTGLNTIIAQQTYGQYQTLSIQLILGYCFAPIMWLLGISSDDILTTGQLLGEKLMLTELIGYMHLGELKAAGGILHQKSVIMATYFLSGFANFASIGVQIGCLGALAPERKGLVTRLAFKAMIAGTLVSLLSSSMIGMWLS